MFAAGDDDQSIYGFRNAFPFGIRKLVEDVEATDLRLEYCRRSARNILQLADFVIRLAPRIVYPKNCIHWTRRLIRAK